MMQVLTEKQLRIATYKLALVQLAVAISCALMFFIIKDASAAKAALKGGLIALIPNLLFALIFFRQNAYIDANQVLAQLRKANTVKMILTIVLFSLVLSQQPEWIGALFTGFLFTLLAQWSATFFFKH
jgi:ATP synthase protein I